MKFNWCVTCEKRTECLREGIFERESCEDYEPSYVEEQLAQQRFVESLLVQCCPECGSEEVIDCDHEPGIDDRCVGACLACGTHWCLECLYVFKKDREKSCPHWGFCDACKGEHGYMEDFEFMKKVCPKCEHYDKGCRLEDPSKCDKEDQLLCPYRAAPSECPKLSKYLEELD